MKLTIGERIAALDLIPAEGDYPALVEYRKIKELIPFSGEEIEEYEIKFDGGGVRWNFVKAVVYLKDIPFTEWMTRKMQDILREKNVRGALKEIELTLYEKFVVFYQN